MSQERRKSENAAMRGMVDAMKNFVAARDALWSLGILDRLFRFEKYRSVIDNYDNAISAMRNAMRAVTQASAKGGEKAGQKSEPTPQVISVEEFEMLLGKPEIVKKLPKTGSRTARNPLLP